MSLYFFYPFFGDIINLRVNTDLSDLSLSILTVSILSSHDWHVYLPGDVNRVHTQPSCDQDFSNAQMAF